MVQNEMRKAGNGYTLSHFLLNVIVSHVKKLCPFLYKKEKTLDNVRLRAIEYSSGGKITVPVLEKLD